MFTADQITAFCRRMADFTHRIQEVPGADPERIKLSLPIEVCGNEVVLEEDALHFAVVTPDFTHEFIGDKPNPKTVLACVKAYKATCEAASRNENLAQALVCSMANNGYVYVENMDSHVIELFLHLWSDAYGEDEPDLYIKTSTNEATDETVVSGYIRTRLTSADIAARNNEDGIEK